MFEAQEGGPGELARVVAAGNRAYYNSANAREYIDGAPHIKHASLRALYARLILDIFGFARAHHQVPEVLDLGAGEGSVTLPFLELGARVTAVDISRRQLDDLEKKAGQYAAQLKVRCEDVVETTLLAEKEGRQYDIIVANSFLHHIPDYLSLIRNLLRRIGPNGQFFSFQDPMRHDSLGRLSRLFSLAAYGSWRICKSDVWGGIRRRLRRQKGVYIVGDPYDETEYHAVRGGVDQEAVHDLFQEHGFTCRVLRYFSTQSRFWQPAGAWLQLENTFAIVARRTGGTPAAADRGVQNRADSANSGA